MVFNLLDCKENLNILTFAWENDSHSDGTHNLPGTHFSSVPFSACHADCMYNLSVIPTHNVTMAQCTSHKSNIKSNMFDWILEHTQKKHNPVTKVFSKQCAAGQFLPWVLYVANMHSFMATSHSGFKTTTVVASGYYHIANMYMMVQR